MICIVLFFFFVYYVRFFGLHSVFTMLFFLYFCTPVFQAIAIIVAIVNSDKIDKVYAKQ